MNVSGISNVDTTVTNQGNYTRTKEIAGGTGEKEIAGATAETKVPELDNPVELTISDEGKEQYRKSIEPYQTDIKEQEKVLDIFRNGTVLTSSGLEASLCSSLKESIVSGKGNIQEKAEDLLGVYAKMYDEISKGYDNGTKAFYVSDNKAHLTKLTKEEALAELDRSYGRVSEQMEAWENIRRREEAAMPGFAKWAKEIAELKESRGRDATEERNFLRDYEQKKQRNKAADDIEIEGFSKKMLDVTNDFKEQYGKKDIHTILSELGLFERLKMGLESK